MGLKCLFNSCIDKRGLTLIFVMQSEGQKAKADQTRRKESKLWQPLSPSCQLDFGHEMKRPEIMFLRRDLCVSADKKRRNETNLRHGMKKWKGKLNIKERRCTFWLGFYYELLHVCNFSYAFVSRCRCSGNNETTILDYSSGAEVPRYLTGSVFMFTRTSTESVATLSKHKHVSVCLTKASSRWRLSLLMLAECHGPILSCKPSPQTLLQIAGGWLPFYKLLCRRFTISILCFIEFCPTFATCPLLFSLTHSFRIQIMESGVSVSVT